jgi:hypothetical protein
MRQREQFVALFRRPRLASQQFASCSTFPAFV